MEGFSDALLLIFEYFESYPVSRNCYSLSLPSVLILQQKADLLSSIENTHTQKLAWLSNHDLPSTLSEFSALTSDAPDYAHCLSLWAELNQAKIQCSESNTVNGIIIAKSRKRMANS